MLPHTTKPNQFIFPGKLFRFRDIHVPAFPRVAGIPLPQHFQSNTILSLPSRPVLLVPLTFIDHLVCACSQKPTYEALCQFAGQRDRLHPLSSQGRRDLLSFPNCIQRNIFHPSSGRKNFQNAHDNHLLSVGFNPSLCPNLPETHTSAVFLHHLTQCSERKSLCRKIH